MRIKNGNRNNREENKKRIANQDAERIKPDSVKINGYSFKRTNVIKKSVIKRIEEYPANKVGQINQQQSF
ncbi:MAG: hypothetical protein KBG47_06000 [Bacteroidia bacterium]|nr:hypothetical protein [Bacteroidia bacterium]